MLVVNILRVLIVAHPKPWMHSARSRDLPRPAKDTAGEAVHVIRHNLLLVLATCLDVLWEGARNLLAPSGGKVGHCHTRINVLGSSTCTCAGGEGDSCNQNGRALLRPVEDTLSGVGMLGPTHLDERR